VAERSSPASARAQEAARAQGGAAIAAQGPALAAAAFDRDTAVRRLAGTEAAQRASEVSFSAELSPAWQAMRGPHGGYLAAILLRALIEAAGEGSRAPRSLTVHYARAPVTGEAIIRTRLEREGRSLSTLSARMEQEGELVALALAAFSVPWSAPEVDELPIAAVAAPDPARETPQLLLERIEAGQAPPFLRQLVFQPRSGAPPFSGIDGPMEGAAWLGLADPARALDPVALAMFSDVGIPPPLMRLREPATSSTLDLTIHFRTRTPRAHDDPAQLCLAELRTRLIHEGFFESDGVIWAPDGAVLAQSRQLAVVMPARAHSE
jgi:acyl-CoA thioesterase